MSNKVIYLNEETQELTSDKDIESQFSTNEQFTEKVDVSNSNSGETLASVNNSGGELNILNVDDSAGESNYGVDGIEGGSVNKKLELDDDFTPEERVNMMRNKVYNGGDGDSDGDAEFVDESLDELEGGNNVEELEGGDDSLSVDSDISGGSSVNTNQILEMDPMYIRLTKFLQTGGENNKNLADILLDISNNFTKLNENLEKLSANMTNISLQQ
tara:strand:+ start:40 stop:684 length:645 start_codon:yes stop_codon:yes gene_type:complete